MKLFSLICLMCLCAMGCTIGHPEKTSKIVSESDLVGTWTYRTELTLTLKPGGVGTQTFDGKDHRLTWSLTKDNHIELNGVRHKFGTKTEIDNFKFIVSDDYRNHFYFFGGPVDFDNYEIWKKAK